jgi:ribosomal protein S24E
MFSFTKSLINLFLLVAFPQFFIAYWGARLIIKNFTKILIFGRTIMKKKELEIKESKSITLKNCKHIRDFLFDELSKEDREILVNYIKDDSGHWKSMIVSYDNPEISTMLETGHYLIGKNKLFEVIRRLKLAGTIKVNKLTNESKIVH